MGHPLIDRLTADFAYPLLQDPAALDAFTAAPGAHVLFVPGDAARNLETPDVAVILPELRAAFQQAFDPRFAVSKRAKDQCAVGNGLVARDWRLPRERLSAPCRQRIRGQIMGGVGHGLAPALPGRRAVRNDCFRATHARPDSTALFTLPECCGRRFRRMEALRPFLVLTSARRPVYGRPLVQFGTSLPDRRSIGLHRRKSRRGKSGPWHKAYLRELRDEILRSRQEPDHLPQMRH